MEKQHFGFLPNGREVHLYSFENKSGMKLVVSDLGAVITNLWVRDGSKRLRDVVLGYPDFDRYVTNVDKFGATIGRSANRIAGARFELLGKSYLLPANEGENSLHSGPNGYEFRIFDIAELDEANNRIVFQLISPDGDQGFPGTLKFVVSYQLFEDNMVRISYRGKSDQTTVFNPTNHSYFNLNGHASGQIHKHLLQIEAAHYTPVAKRGLIPTGEVVPVAHTPMDFRTMRAIGIGAVPEFEQLIQAGGYDHNYALDKAKGVFAKVASVKGDESGILMEVATNLPGLQLYTGNGLDGVGGKEKTTYEKNAALCLETQFYPNAVNQTNFASPLLEKGETVNYVTTFRFSQTD